MVAYVHHESFEVRAIVARICGELGVGRVAPLLRSRLNDESWPVRAALAEALGRLKQPDTSAALVPLLVDTEESVREAAADALTSFPPSELTTHMDAFAAAYDNGSVLVRTKMVVSWRASRESWPIRCSFERAWTRATRFVCARSPALGDGNGEVMVEPLVARLTDASLEVRMAARRGARQRGQHRCLRMVC